ncbi:MAG: HIT family protein [Bacilli bacterium]|jgi:histidine triad (HIT) family protein|nr:HIT family protein [Bacillota bacterium]NLM31815.1 HIT family protein [Acholeplasmataceae bacterium]HOA78097.1 HIT family protein [Bacilli bacterium]HPZ26577.1 HIT family protein [Bacilli bacterium]HQC89051.1 HIT family protein [Bacilli bacterium]
MCVFCKIVNGDIPSHKIYEDDDFIAILDIAQSTIGHALIITKKHYDNVFALPEETAGKLGALAVKLANHINGVLGAGNMNLLNNAGPLAGQTVNHFHLHLIPRYENDGMIIKFDNNKLTEAEFNDLRAKLEITKK